MIDPSSAGHRKGSTLVLREHYDIVRIKYFNGVYLKLSDIENLVTLNLHQTALSEPLNEHSSQEIHIPEIKCSLMGCKEAVLEEMRLGDPGHPRLC